MAQKTSARRRPVTIDQDGREVRLDGIDSDPVSPFSAETDQNFGWDGVWPQELTHEQRIARLDALARLLDVAFILPGTNIRYGLDGLIGLVPIIGDLLTTAISLWIVREARALGAPRYLIARMLANVALDGVVGLVPVVGDAFDVAWRANLRNVRMLKKWLDRNG